MFSFLFFYIHTGHWSSTPPEIAIKEANILYMIKKCIHNNKHRSRKHVNLVYYHHQEQCRFSNFKTLLLSHDRYQLWVPPSGEYLWFALWIHSSGWPLLQDTTVDSIEGISLYPGWSSAHGLLNYLFPVLLIFLFTIHSHFIHFLGALFWRKEILWKSVLFRTNYSARSRLRSF
jgi:hypothetical protein